MARSPVALDHQPNFARANNVTLASTSTAGSSVHDIAEQQVRELQREMAALLNKAEQQVRERQKEAADIARLPPEEQFEATAALNRKAAKQAIKLFEKQAALQNKAQEQAKQLFDLVSHRYERSRPPFPLFRLYLIPAFPLFYQLERDIQKRCGFGHGHSVIGSRPPVIGFPLIVVRGKKQRDEEEGRKESERGTHRP